jgi:hypothetical protein
MWGMGFSSPSSILSSPNKERMGAVYLKARAITGKWTAPKSTKRLLETAEDGFRVQLIVINSLIDAHGAKTFSAVKENCESERQARKYIGGHFKSLNRFAQEDAPLVSC